MKTLVIATRNPGKTVEIRELLADFPINIKNLADFGPIPPVVVTLAYSVASRSAKTSSVTASRPACSTQASAL